MRTGAIFARGSCRALKWVALFGVVFALGAAQAAAQVTIKTPKSVDEAGRLTISVSAAISVAPGLTAATTITVATSVVVRTDDGTEGTDLSDAEEAEGLTVAEEEDFDSPVPASLMLTVLPHPTGGTADPVKRTLTGEIVVQTRPDLDAEDEGIQLTFTLTNGDATNVLADGGAALGIKAPGAGGNGMLQTDGTLDANVTIKDTDDQVFEWKRTTTSPREGASIELTLTAEPTPVNREYVTAIRVDKDGYTVSPTSFTFDATASAADAPDGPMVTITITPPNPDGDRDTDTITLSAVMGGTNIDRATPLEIEVTDIHGLPMAEKITAKAYMDDDGDKGDDEAMSVMEGGDPVHVTVTVDRGEKGYPSGEKLEVAVMADSSQALDYRVEPAEIEIASGTGKKSATFMLWALADDDIGMEDLMLHLTTKGATAKNGSGEVMSMFSIPIEDTSIPLVSAKDDAYDAIMMALGEDPLNPGDDVMIMTGDLFEYDDDMVSVSFGASVEGGAVGASASGEAVTVMAMEPGEAKVTVTATASPMSDSLMITQDRANVAQLTFPVSVVMSDLSLTVTADPMEIDEGGMSTITAMASREVAAGDGEVKVDLEVVGDGELSASSITIEAGEMTGTATVTAMEDDEDYEDETLTVIARGAGEATLTIMVTDNDEAPEPTNLVTAKSSEDIEAVLVAAGLGDDAHFHPGDTAMVDASMLFDAAEGVSVTYAAESDDMAAASPSTSGSMVTVTAGNAGHAHITITATATMASGIEIHTGQPATNVATVVFSVNVVPADLVLTLSGPDDMNIVEGGMGGMVTVTANRAVTEDITVMIMRDRAASSAGDDDYTLDPEMITIKADEMMGSAMVMAVEDEMMENVDNMPEELVLYAMAGDMEVKGEVKLYIWDAAVPALPVIAQLLLAAFLAIGGYRRYRRR